MGTCIFPLTRGQWEIKQYIKMLPLLPRCSVQNVVQLLGERTGPPVEGNVKFGSVTTDIG